MNRIENQVIDQAFTERVIEIAGSAADLVLAMQAAGLRNIATKSNETDLVTEADKASEHFLRAELGALLPQAGFWGEESNQQPEAGLYWLVDPIDGTVNFAHGLAYHAINIALVESVPVENAPVENAPVEIGSEHPRVLLAVTQQMPYRRLYYARPGAGAFLREPQSTERRLQVSNVDTLRAAFLATGFPYHSGEYDDANDLEFAWFAPKVLGMRVLGAAALDAAQVAAGMLAGFWEGWLNPWDCAAGALLVREAGGRVTDYVGNEWQFGAHGFVATNGHIHDLLIEGILSARKPLKNRRMPV